MEDAFRERWRCPKCKTPHPKVRKVALSGTGLSRLLDWQYQEYIMVSCSKCGYTEVYDASTLTGEEKAIQVLDLLLGA